MKDFNQWLSTFRESIANYEYYIDFNTVYENASKYKTEINMLNGLINSKNIEEEFKELVNKYPSVLNCIPTLIAKREMTVFCMDKDGTYNFDFKNMNYTIDDYVMFMRKTGLFELLENHLVSNLYDYVIGVEVGLNTNARKNRGGHLMEDLVEKYIVDSGLKKNDTYFKEMYLSEVETKFNLDLSALSNNGKTKKRFDFVLVKGNCIYAIETNFYAGNGGGSKLNETARSYKMLAEESKNIKGFRFVWITDGTAWNSAKNNLKETFDVLEDIYNIKELEEGILNNFSDSI